MADDKLGQILASFEALTESQLRHEARKWAISAGTAQDKLAHVLAADRYQADENTLKLARVAALLNMQRKTLRMADLAQALRETCDLEAETAQPVERVSVTGGAL